MVITIVGGGATSLSFLYSYLASVPGKNMPTTVYLLDKRGCFGSGAAYEPDVASNILNSKTGFITPFYDRPGDFFNWLTESQPIWRKSFPDFRLEQDNYAPRPLFGMYLRSKMTWLVKEALIKNVQIIQVDAEVKDITMSGKIFVIQTDCSLSLASDYVFLCCGTLPAKQTHFGANVNTILGSPYPISGLVQKIPVDARVGIIGSRLSGIDAVIGLIENGHKGAITIYSRSGYFPSVRGTQGRITPKLLTADHIDDLVNLNGNISLHDVIELITNEISLLSDTPRSREIPSAPMPPLPPEDLEAYLAKEIGLAQESRNWQAVLYSTNSVIDKLWMALEDAEKAEFLSKHFSAFMSYRVSIPAENARKILGYLQSGKLFFRPGAFTMTIGADDKPIINMETTRHPSSSYDFVINATGSPRCVTELNSDLLTNLLQRGTLTPHKFGGISVDQDTYQVIGESGRKSHLYAMGELTTGTFFFTSALEINARHARNCAMKFIESVHNSGQVDQAYQVKQARYSWLSLKHISARLTMFTHRQQQLPRQSGLPSCPVCGAQNISLND